MKQVEEYQNCDLLRWMDKVIEEGAFSEGFFVNTETDMPMFRAIRDRLKGDGTMKKVDKSWRIEASGPTVVTFPDPTPGLVQDVGMSMSPLRALMQEINLDRAQGRTATAISHDKWLELIEREIEANPRHAEKPIDITKAV